MPWWRRLRPSPTPPEAMDAASPVPVRDVTTLVDDLRVRLQQERGRLRPDTRQVLWECVDAVSATLPSWDRAASLRAADATALNDLLRTRIHPALEDFLSLPDVDKPAHADAFHGDVLRWTADVERHRRRLVHALTGRWEALRELDGDGDL